jgi:Zn-dependent protease
MILRRSRGMLIGRFFGIDVYAGGGWFLMLGLFAWMLGEGFFRPHFPDGAGVYVMGLLASLLIYACVLAHEFGHALTARSRGIEVDWISLHFLHGSARLRREPDNPRDDLWIALAGPLVNVALALLFFLALQAQAPQLLQGSATAALSGFKASPTALILLALCWANALLTPFNLIPAFPLDGGRALRALFWKLTGNLVRSTRWAAALGRISGCAMAGLGGGLAVEGELIGGASLLMIGVFINVSAQRACASVELREGLKDITAGQLMSDASAALEANLSLDAAAREFLRLNQRYMPVVDFQGDYMGMVAAEEFAKYSQEQWPKTTLQGLILQQADGMRWLCRQLTVDPSAEGLRVYAYLRHNPFGKLPVVQDQRLVGVISRNRLLELLRARGIEF